MNPNPSPTFSRHIPLAVALAIACLGFPGTAQAARPAVPESIKSYCLDFNWGANRQFAAPGSWNQADPAQHAAWYKAIGANVIQTFAVSCNGYAWSMSSTRTCTRRPTR